MRRTRSSSKQQVQAQPKPRLDKKRKLDAAAASSSIPESHFTSRAPDIILEPPRDLTSYELNCLFSTRSVEARDAYNLKFSKRPFEMERGVVLNSMSECIRKIFAIRKWDKLVTPRNDRFNGTVVSEFYAQLSTMSIDPTRPLREKVWVRNRMIEFTPQAINDHLGLPATTLRPDYHDSWSLGQPIDLSMWAERARTFLHSDAPWHKGRFKAGKHAPRDSALFKNFMAYNLWPTSHSNEFSKREACLALAFFCDEDIDVGKVIYKRVLAASSGKDNRKLLFPHLIFELCFANPLSMCEFPNDLKVAPSTILVGPGIHNSHIPMFLPPCVTPLMPSLTPTRELSVETPLPPTSTSFVPPPPTSQSSSGFTNTPDLLLFMKCMETEMATIRGSQESLNANLRASTEHFTRISNDLREGLQNQHKFLEALNANPRIQPAAFYPCQSTAYSIPVWVYPPPTSAPHSWEQNAPNPFGGLGSSFYTGNSDGFSFGASAGFPSGGISLGSTGGFAAFSAFADLSAGMQHLGFNSSASLHVGFDTSQLFSPTAPIEKPHTFSAAELFGSELITSTVAESSRPVEKIYTRLPRPLKFTAPNLTSPGTIAFIDSTSSSEANSQSDDDDPDFE